MPKYNYACQHCNAEFQVRLSFSEVDEAQPECPECASADTQRQISRINFIGGSNKKLTTNLPPITTVPT